MAEKKFEEASRKARDLFQKGTQCMERDNFEYAMDLFLSVLDMEPNLTRARSALRAAQVKQYQTKKVSHAMTSLSGMGKKMKAGGLLKKEPLQALRLSEELLCKDIYNTSFVNMNIEAAKAAGMPEVGVLTLELAKQADPQNADMLQKLGDLYTEVERHADARDCYEIIFRMKPKDQAALKQLKDAEALASMQKGKWEQEGSFRDKVKDSDAATKSAQNEQVAESEDNIEQSINSIKREIKKEPENVNNHRALARVLAKAKRFQESIDALDAAQVAAGAADPQIDLAISQTRIQEYEFNIKGLRADGKEAEADALETKKVAFAFNDLQDRVKRYPNDLQFRFDYGVMLFDKDEINDAVQQFQLAQRNPSSRIRALYYMALCFKSKNQYDIALEQLEKAAAELNVMDENKKDIVYEMGLLCELMENKEKAIELYKTIYSADIGFRDVAERIEQAYEK